MFAYEGASQSLQAKLDHGWVPFTFEPVPVSVPETRYRYTTVTFFGTLLSV